MSRMASGSGGTGDLTGDNRVDGDDRGFATAA